jgi:hypothetical protein
MTDGAQVTEHRPLEYKEIRPIKANLSCHFCGRVFSETLPLRGYVYPIVGETMDIGGNACVECYPIEWEKSVAAGLIVPLTKTKESAS